jgi:putative transposase
MTVRYRCRRPDDAALRQRLRALAHERRRFGYRRLHVLLRRERFTVNHKRLFRLYREGAPPWSAGRWSQADFGHAGADAGPDHRAIARRQ